MFTAKILGAGQLASTKQTLYEVPALTKAYIKFVSCFNLSTEQTVLIYVNGYVIARAVLGQNESSRVIGRHDALTLGAGDIIEGESTDASAVDYVITGVEEI